MNNLNRVLLAITLLMLSLTACNLPLASDEVIVILPTPILATETSSPATTPPTAPPTPTAAIVYTPVFETAPCQFVVPAGYSPECGYLIVPENRQNPSTRFIRLHTAIFRSPNPVGAPVIHLTGGPGSAGLDLMGYHFNSGHEAFLEKHDYIIFDQRGVGYSDPILSCFNSGGQMKCRDNLLAEGIDLTAYNSAASAADIYDLRIALGYEEVNLFGVSYGTRLALTVMRDRPDGIRSVIMDSMYPPQVNLYRDWAPNANRAFEATFDACAADLDCNSRYPNLRTTFYSLVDRLNIAPITVDVSTASGTEQVVVSGDLMLDVLFLGHYNSFHQRQMPKLIYEVSNGEYGYLSTRLIFYVGDGSRGFLGMRNSVQCYEEIPFETFEDWIEATEGIPPQLSYFATRLENFYNVCQTWGAGTPNPIENEPIHSDIPTLILSGQFDPITPPEWGRLAAETLPNSYVYHFPDAGHWVLRSGPCGWEVVLAFLDDPTAAPDGSCIESLAPSFK